MKTMTGQLMALLLSLCLLPGGIAESTEGISTEPVKQTVLEDNTVGGDSADSEPVEEVSDKDIEDVFIDDSASEEDSGIEYDGEEVLSDSFEADGEEEDFGDGEEDPSDSIDEDEEEGSEEYIEEDVVEVEDTDATATVEDDTLIVEAEDVEQGGVSVGTVADGEHSNIYVTIGDEHVDTEDAFDDYDEPIVDEVDVSVGDVTDEDYGIGVSAYDYDDEADIDVTVSAGDVRVSGEDDAIGIAVYDYNSDVDISTGSVTVDSGEGEAVGIDVIADGESQAKIEVDGDVEANGGSEAVGIDVTAEGESQIDITVQGDVEADGENGAGIRVQGAEAEGGTEEAPVSIVVTGTVSGTDTAIQVSEGMAENTQLTAWSVEENKDGELAQVIDDGGKVNEEASGLLERAIQYIVRIADEFKNRLSVSTGKTVTVGEETYQTAAEDEEITLQVSLSRNEVLRGIYYNDDKGTEAEYTPEGDNFLIRMLRGGAMLLGLDIDWKEPEPEPRPVVIDEEDEKEHHSHRSSSNEKEHHSHRSSSKYRTEFVYVDILNKEVVMNSSEIAQFDALSLEDRMLVMMAAMGLSDTAGDFRANLSDAARVLAAEIDSRVAMMSDSERASRAEEVNVFFPPRLVTVNGVSYEGVGIVLVINTNGKKSYERYDYYNDNGVWKLHQIVRDKYAPVD